MREEAVEPSVGACADAISPPGDFYLIIVQLMRVSKDSGSAFRVTRLRSIANARRMAPVKSQRKNLTRSHAPHRATLSL
jgi:hypothetical protein